MYHMLPYISIRASNYSKGELGLQKLKYLGYASVVSLQDYPTIPFRWQYGVELKYRSGALDGYCMDNKCHTCDTSSGLYGCAPPDNSFICLCSDEINTPTGCDAWIL
ncbi:hypothetical protein OIU78_020939 [Salix suchowensis]|nr:hypothetical protein OIU78_020939 [Salix suchowensis]